MIHLRTYGLAIKLDFIAQPDDWFSCEVYVEVPGFQGSFSCWVWRRDLERFTSQLEEMISRIGEQSSARLESTEPGIAITLSMNDRGHIDGKYCLRNFDAPGSPTLSGAFDIDQTYLRPLLRDITNVLTEQLQPPAE